jgi:hypothetical protein
MQARSRVSLFLAATILSCLFASANAAEPVGITAIDARAGVVTARDATGKLTLQFKVTDAALLKSLKVGQTVQADVGTQRVSIGGPPCCAIVSVQTGAQAPGATGSAMQNAGGDPLGTGGMPPVRIGSELLHVRGGVQGLRGSEHGVQLYAGRDGLESGAGGRHVVMLMQRACSEASGRALT